MYFLQWCWWRVGAEKNQADDPCILSLSIFSGRRTRATDGERARERDRVSVTFTSPRRKYRRRAPRGISLRQVLRVPRFVFCVVLHIREKYQADGCAVLWVFGVGWGWFCFTIVVIIVSRRNFSTPFIDIKKLWQLQICYKERKNV